MVVLDRAVRREVTAYRSRGRTLVATIRPEGVYLREKGRRHGIRETVTRNGRTRTTALGVLLPWSSAWLRAETLEADRVRAERGEKKQATRHVRRGR